MTPKERDAHRKQMNDAKNRDECLAVFGEHMKQMAERAQAQGKTVPGPRRDPCERFAPQ